MSEKKEVICDICKEPSIYTVNGICFGCAEIPIKATMREMRDLILWCLENHRKIETDKAVAEWERLQKVKGEFNDI